MALAELDGQLRLDAEVPAEERDGFEQVGPHRLVASLHVGEVEVGDDVGEEGEEAVAELVPVEQHPPHLAADEAGPEDGVGVLLHEDLDDAQQIARVVLEVGVVDDGDLAGGVLQRGADRLALSTVALVAKEQPGHFRIRAQIALELLEHGGGIVLGGVVDDDDLDSLQVRAGGEDLEPLERGGDEKALVVDGNEDRKGSHAVAAPSRQPGAPTMLISLARGSWSGDTRPSI